MNILLNLRLYLIVAIGFLLSAVYGQYQTINDLKHQLSITTAQYTQLKQNYNDLNSLYKSIATNSEKIKASNLQLQKELSTVKGNKCLDQNLLPEVLKILSKLQH